MAHQSLHGQASNPDAVTVQLPPDLAGSIDLIVGVPDPADLDLELVIALLTWGGLALLGRVIAAGRHLEHPTDGLDPEAVPAGIDHPDHLVRGRSSSAAKNALAAFKISLARRNSRFSRSNSAMRW